MVLPASGLGAASFRRAGAKAALIAGCAIGLSSAADAQGTAPQPPLAPTREEVARPTPEPVQQGAARLTVEGGVERAPCALDRPEYQNIRFTLTDVAFDGLRDLPAEALRPAYGSLIGQEQPVSIICEIRDRAATILRDAGYVAAVEVPEQRIQGGTLRFQVLMAKLVGLRVRGDAGRAERLIASYLEPLTRQEVFNRFEAERALLLAGDLPGYNVRLSLRSAGQARGEVIGEVVVVRTPLLVDFAAQNYGSRELGRWGGLLRAQFFGLTGLGDRTVLAAYSTADFHEQRTLQVAHDFRLGGSGLGFGGQLTYAWAEPDLNDPAVHIDSETLFATVEADYPFVRSQAQSLRGAIGLDIVDQDVEFNELPFSRDRLRVAFARFTYDAQDVNPADARYSAFEPRWRMAAYAEARQGLDILGASEGCGPALQRCLQPNVVPPTRLEGDPTGTVFRGAVSGEYRPVPRLTAAASARAQYSRDPLFSFEEFSAGNYTIGRGYDPGAILGDSGLGVQAELRYGSTFPAGPQAWAVEPFVFLDQAWTWNEDRLVVLGRQEVTSVGAGIRAAWGDRLRLDVQLAVPLDRTLLQPERDPRLLISLTTRLWPWSFR
jgi:hemolysin activation/secretion protein